MGIRSACVPQFSCQFSFAICGRATSPELVDPQPQARRTRPAAVTTGQQRAEERPARLVEDDEDRPVDEGPAAVGRDNDRVGPGRAEGRDDARIENPRGVVGLRRELPVDRGDHIVRRLRGCDLQAPGPRRRSARATEQTDVIRVRGIERTVLVDAREGQGASGCAGRAPLALRARWALLTGRALRTPVPFEECPDLKCRLVSVWFFTFLPVTARSFSSLVPTLLAGSLNAA